MGTPHNSAKVGDIADKILLPGDPLRAKYIAENFFENPVCFNEVRGMLGFTGTYKGQKVSVMGTGMGMPSTSIYVTELMQVYGIKKAIRIGTCGCFDEDIKVGSVVIGISASTDSNINHRDLNADYAAACDFELLYNAYNTAIERKIPVHVSKVLSSDLFYKDDPDEWKKWAHYGVKNVEMESNAIYTIAAKFGVKALAIFTVSDHMLSKAELTTDERQTKLNDMITLALDTIIK